MGTFIAFPFKAAYSFCISHGSYEVYEGHRRKEANDQERDCEDTGGTASVEAEGVLRCSCILRRDRLRRGEKDRDFYRPGTLQDQDSHKTSDQSRREEHLRQGGEGCGKTSEEGGQSLPSGSFEGTDLSNSKLASKRRFQRLG